MTAATQYLSQRETSYAHHTTSSHATPRLVRAARTLWQWYERADQRRHLSGLTARELVDIGVTPAAAAAEASKPFWRA